jgi:hypothetical protein
VAGSHLDSAGVECCNTLDFGPCILWLSCAQQAAAMQIAVGCSDVGSLRAAVGFNSVTPCVHHQQGACVFWI